MNSIYMNNAASAWPLAPGVTEAMQLALQRPPEHPGRSASACNSLTACREGLARMLAVDDPSRIVLTTGSTHSLNLAILGLGLPAGAHVITTVTEHNSALRPLFHLRDILSLRLTIIGLDERGALDAAAYRRALEEEPALVVLNHASNVTGRVNDAADWFEQAHAADAATLLDASQTLGCIPVQPKTLNADLVAFTGHKGLRGPAGTGGLYVGEGVELQQVFVGGTGVRSDLLHHPPEMPTRLEAGTPSAAAFAGLAEAVQWAAAGMDERRRIDRQRAGDLREALRRVERVSLIDDDDSVERCSVLSFHLAGWSVEEAGYVLENSFGVVCRTGLHCAPLIHEPLGCGGEGTIRLSPSAMTTPEEVAATISAVERLAA